jgi:hypothetical protein
MDLTKEEYERLIELQAVALGCAERSLATLREAHEKLKKELEEERKLTRDLRRQIVAAAQAKAQEVLA